MPALYWCGDDGLVAPKLGVLGDEDSLLAEVCSCGKKAQILDKQEEEYHEAGGCTTTGVAPFNYTCRGYAPLLRAF